jgi:predicted RNase H-like HicB family nuclease
MRRLQLSDYHINVLLSDEDGGYIADIPDLEACSAFGASPEEALAEVENAKEAWIAAAARGGKAGPRSRATGRRSTPDRSEPRAFDAVGRGRDFLA